MAHPLTLFQHLLEHLAEHPDQKELVMIMSDLATIGKFISKETNRAGLADILGAAGMINAQQEEAQKLDGFANAQCKNFLRQTGHFAAMASEEEDTVVDMGKNGASAKYVIAFDPLDGSSNIDVNISIGTIFSVHKRLENIERVDEKQFLQKGREQVLAGYILYGSSTVLVFSFGLGVHEFTLDQSVGEFLLSREKMAVPEICKIYSFNEGYIDMISEKNKKFVGWLKQEKKCGIRYVGSLVADFHRNLIKGGVFVYPGVDKEKTGEYKNKLRLNYEAKPMAYLLEQAGGLSTDGQNNILDIQPSSLHQRVPLIMGNKDIIEEYLKM